MTISTEIVLVRHAETTIISNNRIHGQTDAPLTEPGLTAARRTAENFRGQKFDAFYSSSLGRAMKTAEIIGDAIQLLPIPVDGLRERNYGWLEGKPIGLFEPDLTGPAFMHPIIKFALRTSGESDEEFPRRVLNTFNEIYQRHMGQRIMLVVHWGILSILTRYFRYEDMNGWQGVGPWTPCGISEIHKNGSGWQILRLNDHSHL